MKLLREYIRALLLESASRPKAIFMAGGPGSGKSTVIRKLGLTDKLHVVNPDDQYEANLKAENIPLNRSAMLQQYREIKTAYAEALANDDEVTISKLEPDFIRLRELFSKNMSLFYQARQVANEKQQEHEASGQGFLVDGTGGNYGEIAKKVARLQAGGYDVGMVFVDVPLETSIERNRTRGATGGRKLEDEEVTRSWNAVNKNVQKYEDLFGDAFFHVNADEHAFDRSIDSVHSRMSKFLAEAHT